MTPSRLALLRDIADASLHRSAGPRWWNRRAGGYVRRDTLQWLIDNDYVVLQPGWRLHPTQIGYDILALAQP